MQFLRDVLLVGRAKIFSVISRRISQPGNQRPVLRALLRYVPFDWLSTPSFIETLLLLLRP